MQRHKVTQLLYNSKGGLFESYLCGKVGGGNGRQKGGKKPPQNRLVQSIKVNRET